MCTASVGEPSPQRLCVGGGSSASSAGGQGSHSNERFASLLWPQGLRGGTCKNDPFEGLYIHSTQARGKPSNVFSFEPSKVQRKQGQENGIKQVTCYQIH